MLEKGPKSKLQGGCSGIWVLAVLWAGMASCSGERKEGLITNANVCRAEPERQLSEMLTDAEAQWDLSLSLYDADTLAGKDALSKTTLLKKPWVTSQARSLWGVAVRALPNTEGEAVVELRDVASTGAPAPAEKVVAKSTVTFTLGESKARWWWAPFEDAVEVSATSSGESWGVVVRPKGGTFSLSGRSLPGVMSAVFAGGVWAFQSDTTWAVMLLPCLEAKP